MSKNKAIRQQIVAHSRSEKILTTENHWLAKKLTIYTQELIIAECNILAYL